MTGDGAQLALIVISIHAPPRGATGVSFSCLLWLSISIHAPPRGATFPASGIPGVGKISIHAPPRGATFPPLVRPCGITNFNSRPSARGDAAGTQLPGPPRGISIHAPPRGATSPDTTTGRDNHISIHAPPRGATIQLGGQLPRRHFNSRPSARGDKKEGKNHDSSRTFQFTPLREGRRTNDSVTFLCVYISIHAPPRGATGSALLAAGASAISIHAPPRGATGVSFSCLLWLSISIHAPPRGATGRVVFLSFVAFHFNSRPSARGDNAEKSDIVVPQDFNSRPSARGDGNTFGARKRYCISIHAPPRGATHPMTEAVGKTLFQFTPLREGRLR